jgi:hypothetical protein
MIVAGLSLGVLFVMLIGTGELEYIRQLLFLFTYEMVLTI